MSPFAQIVRMSQAVCLLGWPDSFAFRADCEDVSGGALASASQGGTASGQIVGMARAVRLF